jgi:hypothetical protein
VIRSGSLVALSCVLTLGVTAPALGSSAHSSARWTARMSVPTHTPKARKAWPVKIVAKTSSGKAVSGTVQYLFLFNGTVVSTRSCLDVGTTPCKFRGTYRDVLHFPARAIGQSFTLQFVVKSSLGTKKINYPITVVK